MQLAPTPLSSRPLNRPRPTPLGGRSRMVGGVLLALGSLAAGCVDDVTVHPDPKDASGGSVGGNTDVGDADAGNTDALDADVDASSAVQWTRVGPFDFTGELTHTRPDHVVAVHQIRQGDFNGDGLTDVVWNQLDADGNAFYVGHGSADRTLTIETDACAGAPCTASTWAGASDIAWAQFDLHVGDFDGDRRDDLLWLPSPEHSAERGYEIHLLLATDEGFSSKLVSQQLEIGGATRLPTTSSTDVAKRPAQVSVVDLNADGRDDLLYSFVYRGVENADAASTAEADAGTDHSGSDADAGARGITAAASEFTVLDYQALLAEDDLPPFEAQDRSLAFASADASYPDTTITTLAVDLDRDQRVDLLHNMLGVSSDTELQRDPTLSARRNWSTWNRHLPLEEDDDLAFEPAAANAPQFEHSQHQTDVDSPWRGVSLLHGDFDADRNLDVVWLRADANSVWVHRASFEGDGFVERPSASWKWTSNSASAALVDQRCCVVADVNGDGNDDLMLSLLQEDSNGGDQRNRLLLLWGSSDEASAFADTERVIDHPAAGPWRESTSVSGDFDGDGSIDLLWSQPGRRSTVQIAFGNGFE